MSKQQKGPHMKAEPPSRPKEGEVDTCKRKKPPRKQPEKLRARG